MASKWIDWLKLPEAKAVQNLDDPQTTLLHARIIQQKPFLRNLYLDFYRVFRQAVPGIDSKVCVELGSGGGFIKERIPHAVTSDILDLPHLDFHFSVLEMPFEPHSVDAFVMIDLLHHVRDTRRFLEEMDRCLKPGGKIVMIEPANTLWARFVYQNFHHEAFDPSAGWGLCGEGSLSAANGAIPWIVFMRDRAEFEREFPGLKIRKLAPHTPLRYLISGGVSMRALLPSFMYPLVKGLEWVLTPANGILGMFLTIELEKMP